VHIGRSKLMLRGDYPLKILERINDNVYKVDPSYEYDVSVIFNVFDLFLFDIGDNLRSNLFKKRENNSILVCFGFQGATITRFWLKGLVKQEFYSIIVSF